MLCKLHPESWPDRFCHQVWPQMWRQVSVKMRISVATVGAVALIHWSVVVKGWDERCERVTRFGLKPFAFSILIIPLVVSIRFVAYIGADSPALKFPKLWGKLRFRVKRSDIRKITFWPFVAGEHSVGWEQSGAVSSVSTSLWRSWVWQSGWRCYELSCGCLASIRRAGHSTKKRTVASLFNGTSSDKGGTCDVPLLGHALQRRHGTPWRSSVPWHCLVSLTLLYKDLKRVIQSLHVIGFAWILLLFAWNHQIIYHKSWINISTVMKIDETSLPWMALGVSSYSICECR